MARDIDDKLLASPPPDETTAEMDVIKNLFSMDQPHLSTLGDFSDDIFSDPTPTALHPQPAPTAAPQVAEPSPPDAVPYQPRAEEDIKVVTDDDLKNLFELNPPPAPAGAAPLPETMAPAPDPEPIPEPPAAPPEPVARNVEAEEISLDDVAEIAPVALAVPGPAPAPTAAPVDAVDFRREQVAEEAQPDNPLEDISPDEMVADLETRTQVGEMTAVAAGKKGELLHKTESLLQRLEPTGKDLLSVAELTRLYNNMNVLIEWARTMTERLDRLERAIEKLQPGDEP